MRTWSRPPSRGSARSLAGTDGEDDRTWLAAKTKLFLARVLCAYLPHSQPRALRHTLLTNIMSL
jgi:hypothetical protein